MVNPSADERSMLAELMAESAEVRRVTGRRPAGGWFATGHDHSALVLDDDLRVMARFSAPADLVPTGVEMDLRIGPDLETMVINANSRGIESAVSPDERWAAFAGVGGIAVVDPTGCVIWRTAHPHPIDFNGEVNTGAVVFRSGNLLWAYVPVQGTHAPEDGAEGFELWVIDVAEQMVVSRSRSCLDVSYFTVVASWDSPAIGFTSSDGQGSVDGRWTTWNGHEETVLASGAWWPSALDPDRRRWLAVDTSQLFIGDFAQPGRQPVASDEDQGGSAWRYGGCFVTPELVLVNADAPGPGGDQSVTGNRHLLYDVETLRECATVQYPVPVAASGGGDVVSAGDRTWITTSFQEPARRWRLNRHGVEVGGRRSRSDA